MAEPAAMVAPSHTESPTQIEYQTHTIHPKLDGSLIVNRGADRGSGDDHYSENWTEYRTFSVSF